MFVFSFLFFIAFALFVALNLLSAGAAIVGLIILVALRRQRKIEFWPLLLAMTSFFGGAGALGGSWGAYFVASHQTLDWGYSVIAWSLGYVLGGIICALSGAFGVVLRRRRELPLIKNQIKARFGELRKQITRVGFHHSLRIGAYSLRLAFFKRGNA